MKITVEEMEKVLDGLVADGVAWKGEDGRYRIREDVEVYEDEDGDICAYRKPLQ